jgi:uncharacterized protein (TIGR04255 family)
MPTAKYEEPPLNEVVMGVSFAPIKGLHTQYIGRFWERISANYPKSEQAIGYGEPIPPGEGEIYPAPRFWFIADALDKLVQIQSNLFLCNWRKVDGEGIYPEYDEMKKVFRENYGLFLGFLKEMEFDAPVYTECQFSYINHFIEGKEWEKESDLSKIIPSLGFPASFGDEGAINYDLNYAYSLPNENKGKYRMKISTAKIMSTGKRAIIFENSARGLDAESDDIYEWFDYAHEHLVLKFEKITDVKLQNDIWNKQ